MLKYALDIGSYNTRLISGEFTKDGFEIKGAVSGVSDGCFGGVITDYRKLFFSILEILKSFEEKYSRRPKKVLLNCSNGEVKFYHLRECFKRNIPQRPISIKELERFESQILKDKISLDEKEIFVQTEKYRVDGQDGIINPEKMSARDIETTISAITIPTAVYDNIFSLFSEISLEIEDFIPEIIAKASLFLDSDQKKAGVMFIDIGWGKVKSAVFKNGILKNIDVFNSNLKSAYELVQSIYHLDWTELEKVLGGSFITEESDLLIQSKTALENVSVENVRNIMGKNLKKILYRVKKNIDEGNIFHSLSEGVVITGGSILEYPDLESTAFEILKQPVKIEKNKTSFLSNEYSTSLGMLKYASEKEKDLIGKTSKLGLARKTGLKLSRIIERYL